MCTASRTRLSHIPTPQMVPGGTRVVYFPDYSSIGGVSMVWVDSLHHAQPGETQVWLAPLTRRLPALNESRGLAIVRKKKGYLNWYNSQSSVWEGKGVETDGEKSQRQRGN